MSRYYVYEVTRDRLILRAAQRTLDAAMRYWSEGRLITERPMFERDAGLGDVYGASI